MKRIEDHTIGCAFCAERAKETADYIDVIRAAMIADDFDLLNELEFSSCGSSDVQRPLASPRPSVGCSNPASKVGKSR